MVGLGYGLKFNFNYCVVIAFICFEIGYICIYKNENQVKGDLD